MTATAPASATLDEPVLDLVVPVYNEERDLEPSVRQLRANLDRAPFATALPLPARSRIR